MNCSAVLFDLDGTLTKPYLDFDVIRAEIGVEGPILEAIASMDPVARRTAETVLLRYEAEAARCATLQEGALEVVDACRAGGHPVGILTRNARRSVNIILEAYNITVDAVRTRDDGAIKPSAEPALSLCEELAADPRRSWMVGDYLFDIQTGRDAGMRTVLMLGDRPLPDYAKQADHIIRRLIEFLPILKRGVQRTAAPAQG